MEAYMGIRSTALKGVTELKEQIGCRVEPHVKKILDEIAKKEFRTLGNLSEKLICERLHDLGYLDEHFMPAKKVREHEKEDKEGR
jgi:hypothetical protein